MVVVVHRQDDDAEPRALLARLAHEVQPGAVAEGDVDDEHVDRGGPHEGHPLGQAGALGDDVDRAVGGEEVSRS